MTEQIITGNRIIAEFMGARFYNDDMEAYPNGYYLSDYPCSQIKDMEFHKSWDWLIPVCKKWSDLEFDGKDQTWEFDHYNELLAINVLSYEIEHAFNQLVSNIEYYNQIKEK